MNRAHVFSEGGIEYVDVRCHSVLTAGSNEYFPTRRIDRRYPKCKRHWRTDNTRDPLQGGIHKRQCSVGRSKHQFVFAADDNATASLRLVYSEESMSEASIANPIHK